MKLLLEHLDCGDRCFRSGNTMLAKQHYLIARNRGERLLKAVPTDKEVIRHYILASRSVADVYVREKLLHMAELELRESYQLLCESRNKHLSRHEQLNQDLEFGIKRSYSMVLSHIKKHGTIMKSPVPAPDDCCEPLVSAGV